MGIDALGGVFRSGGSGEGVLRRGSGYGMAGERSDMLGVVLATDGYSRGGVCGLEGGFGVLRGRRLADGRECVGALGFVHRAGGVIGLVV